VLDKSPKIMYHSIIDRSNTGGKYIPLLAGVAQDDWALSLAARCVVTPESEQE